MSRPPRALDPLPWPAISAGVATHELYGLRELTLRVLWKLQKNPRLSDETRDAVRSVSVMAEHSMRVLLAILDADLRAEDRASLAADGIAEFPPSGGPPR